MAKDKVYHGLWGTAEYWCYRNILARCYNKKNPQYEDYGGRGITVCDEWLGGDGELSGFECFVRDVGLKPGKGYSINRIDNDIEYCPRNSKWSTRREQQNNRRNTIHVVYKGVEMPLSEAAKLAGVVNSRVAASRFNSGWSVEEAVERPLGLMRTKQFNLKP